MSKPTAMVVRFNVGGKRYEVSRSLLEMHPDTMLARSASVQWQTDPEVEIFIERNGDRFQYVLDYLRDDGRVFVPVTLAREALLADLHYYGITGVDKAKIVACKLSSSGGQSMFHEMHRHVSESIEGWQKEIDAIKIQQACLQLSTTCTSHYVVRKNYWSCEKRSF